MISGQLQPIRRDLDLAFNGWVGADARSRMLADAARVIFAQCDAVNAAAMGRPVDSSDFVDGRRSDDLNRVRPDGVIVRVYNVLPAALVEIGNLLWEHSPFLTGRYQRSHRLLADGAEIAVVSEGWAPPLIPQGTRELVFIPTVPYARLLEPVDGRPAISRKAPDGVYHVIAELMRPAMSSLAQISFGYRELVGVDESYAEQSVRRGHPRDLRQPALIIVPR